MPAPCPVCVSRLLGSESDLLARQRPWPDDFCSPHAPAQSAIHLLSHLYAVRATTTWKQPTHVEWMQKTVSSLMRSGRLQAWPKSQLNADALAYFESGPTLAICRHVMVCEIRSVISFINPSTLTSEMLAYDPLPPDNATTSYNEAYFGPLASIIPRVSRNDRMREFQQMQQRLQQQGGPGIQELLQNMQAMQFAGQDGDDVDEAANIPGPPGGFNQVGEGTDGGSSTGEDDDEGAAPAPGLLQGLWNSLWRRATPAQDQDRDEDSAEE